MTELLTAALEYHARGWLVFPLHDKRHPAVGWKALRECRPTEDDVRAWWTNVPTYWIGVALGKCSNLVRIDVDGAKAAEQLVQLGGCPDAVSFASPSGGVGYLFRHMDGVVTEKLWKGVDEHEELRVQSDGAYTVVPPSPGYSWRGAIELTTIPEWLRDRCVERVLNDLVKELRPTLRQPDRAEVLEALEHVPSDDYDTWVQVGMALKNSGEDQYSVWEKWSRTSDKFKEGECVTKWASFRCGVGGVTTRSILYWAEQAGWRPPHRHEPLTDLGNARVLARMGEGKFKHSEKWGWLAWDGRRWAKTGAEKRVQEVQKSVLEYRFNRAASSLAKHLATDNGVADWEAKRQAKAKFLGQVRKYEDECHVRGARKLAESEPVFSCEHAQFDADPWAFNCINGTLELRELELRPHDPADMLTQLCPVEYHDDAECPRWDKFLSEVFADDVDLIAWVKKLLGFCLTGSVREHVLPIFFGGGRNGKSTLVKAVLNVFGDDYACVAPSGFLIQHRSELHPERLVTLYGKRFVADLETGDSARLNEELIKRLTGGDAIRARDLYQSSWEFKPTHKLILATNHRPRVVGTDSAIWARLKEVPFNVSFQGREDVDLDIKLAAESRGILRWMVEGCQEWLASGLGAARAVAAATVTYKDNEDQFAEFLSTKCELGESFKVKRTPLQQAYRQWCQGNNERELTGRAVSEKLRERGVVKDPTGNYYVGIRLIEEVRP